MFENPEHGISRETFPKLSDRLRLDLKEARIAFKGITGLMLDVATRKGQLPDENFGDYIERREDHRIEIYQEEFDRYIVEKDLGTAATRATFESARQDRIDSIREPRT